VTTLVLLDRDIDKAWMDLAIRLPDMRDVASSRSAIDSLLQQTYLGKQARQKTLTAIARSWITPTGMGMAITLGGRELALTVTDLRPIHFGVLLATQPFFADLTRAVGMALVGAHDVDTNDLRRRMARTWGTRAAVDRSVQATVKTMRSIGVLEGKPTSSASTRVRIPVTDPQVTAWLVACVLVSKSADSIDASEIRTAPELFGFDLPGAIPRDTSWLVRHSEGGQRQVFELRDQSPRV
jgi:hypothetical protein